MSCKRFINCLLLTAQVARLSASTEPSQPNNTVLHQKLDTSEVLTASLAEEVCWDLEIYNDESSTFSTEECMKNFLSPEAVKDSVPPLLRPRCRLSSSFWYSVDYANDESALVVLTPDNGTVINLPYDLLMDQHKEINTIDIVSPGRYKTWTTLINYDGSHSSWRQGPDILTWNVTGDIRQRNYSVQVEMTHEVESDSSKVKASFSWNSFDVEDECFHFVNYCGGRPTEKTISPSMNQSCVVQGLPLGTACELRLTGKYGMTRYVYRTPSCSDLPACIDLERAHNLTIEATEGAVGWDVSIGWAKPHNPPLRYNITLFSENIVRSLVLPGNATSALFPGVEDSGLYDVAVGAIGHAWTAYTSARAQFPARSLQASALVTVLGGSWTALLAMATLLAALALLWRRRHAAPEHIYFPEPEDKLPKEVACEPAGLATEDAWELRAERLRLHEPVGEGAFGVVRRATLAPAREVAVKMLKDFPTLDEIRSFRAEMELMKSVGAHPHLVSLLGCCSGRRPLIVVEYCSRGDLLSYLRCSWDVMVSKRNAKYYNNDIESSEYRNDLFKCKPQGEHSKLVVNKLYDLQGICDTELTTRDLLSFCRQIAMGMEFLALNRLVHRDLAARNVLVSSDRTLKIADFGLSRDVYEENQYKQKGNGKMPMKWMALESLTHRIYTTQSDVWSFGVVMWEVGSVGASPYAGVAGARLPRLLRAGYRMPRPAHCPPQLYELMLSCWRAHPRSRPTFASLHARLDEMLARACAGDYLRLDANAPPPPPPANYVRMLIRSKLGWPREEPYERPLRPVQSNHYSTPPASLVRAPVS